jgi:alkylation response protein AidB-like acyl-CoA dehydrogenase
MAREKVKMSKGGSVMAMAGRKVSVKDHGYIGVALAPRVEVKNGGRVLITPLIAILAGSFFGLGFGLMALLAVRMLGGMGFFQRMAMRRRMRHSRLNLVLHPAHNAAHYARHLAGR